MLDGYVSEKEQIESMRKWWKESGKWLLLAIIIGLALGFGWRYWHAYQARRAVVASVIYQTVLQAEATHHNTQMQTGTQQLMKNYAGSPYASLSALILTKKMVDKNQLPKALFVAQWVIAHSSQKQFQEMGRIDAARIFLAENKPQQALQVLQKTSDAAFSPLVSWVKGDIYIKMHRTKTALEYYEKAKSGLRTFPPALHYVNQQISFQKK